MGYAEYLARDADDSPVASWHHLETSGTSAADSSGNGLTATLGAGVTVNQTSAIPGYDGPVVSCSGASGSTITVPDSSLLDAVDGQGLTFARWLKMDAAGSGDVLYVLADKTALSNTNKQWGVWWDNRVSQGSPKRLRIQWGYGSVGSVFNVDWSGTAARDALLAGGLLVTRFIWNSIGYVYWFDGTALSLVASGALTNYPASPGNVGNTRTLTLGYFNGPNFWFKGQFGPGHVWNTVLGEQDIRSRCAAAVGDPVYEWVKL